MRADVQQQKLPVSFDCTLPPRTRPRSARTGSPFTIADPAITTMGPKAGPNEAGPNEAGLNFDPCPKYAANFGQCATCRSAHCLSPIDLLIRYKQTQRWFRRQGPAIRRPRLQRPPGRGGKGRQAEVAANRTADAAARNPANPDTFDFLKFANRQVTFAGSTWQLESGHHFDSEKAPTWDSAWCYTRRLANTGVEVQVSLVNRASPRSRRHRCHQSRHLRRWALTTIRRENSPAVASGSTRPISRQTISTWTMSGKKQLRRPKNCLCRTDGTRSVTICRVCPLGMSRLNSVGPNAKQISAA